MKLRGVRYGGHRGGRRRARGSGAARLTSNVLTRSRQRRSVQRGRRHDRVPAPAAHGGRHREAAREQVIAALAAIKEEFNPWRRRQTERKTETKTKKPVKTAAKESKIGRFRALHSRHFEQHSHDPWGAETSDPPRHGRGSGTGQTATRGRRASAPARATASSSASRAARPR